MDQVAVRIADDAAVNGFVYGLGPTMATLNTMVADIASTDIPVLIQGESGVGKDTYARLIQRLSQKNGSFFSKINCSSVAPGDLLTQWNELTAGLVKQEVAGSIYLDNIQELDLACQRVLLTYLPDQGVGASADNAGPRLISSTTRNLESEVEAGRFRRELYFRLNGACLRLPALRERREDVPALMEYFLNKHSFLLKKDPPSLSDKSMQTLVAYHWPGNIRELENLARKIVVFGDTQIALNDLQATTITANRPVESGRGTSLKVAARAASKQAERELILEALQRTKWNRKRAAQDLQISYKALLYKLKQIGAPGTEP
jgi:two-component system, NtrC family, response regulator AtoC